MPCPLYTALSVLPDLERSAGRAGPGLRELQEEELALPPAEERIEEVRRARRERGRGWVELCVDALLFDGDALVRSEGIAGLMVAPYSRSIPLLLDTLRSSLRLARRRTAQALLRMDREHVRPRLEAALRSGDARLCRECADLLGRLSDPRSAAVLLEALGHADPAIRAHSALSLGLVSRSAGAPRPATVRSLMDALQDPAERVRKAAARALGLIGDRRAIPALLGLVALGGPASQEAIEVLARLGPGACGEAGPGSDLADLVWLGGMDGDEAQSARDAGVYALRGRAEALEVMLEALARFEDGLGAGRLARAVVNLGTKGIVALRDLARGGRHGSGSTARAAAARALLLEADREAPWPTLARDLSPVCRKLGLQGLQRLSGLGVEELPGELIEDPDPGVAWLARLVAEQDRPWQEERAARLGEHPRSALPSARPPFGIPPPEEADGQRPGPMPAALAAFNVSISSNLGVLMRSAEAAGLAEIFIVGDPRYHPGAARGVDRRVPLTWLHDCLELIDLADARGYSLVAVQQSPASRRYDLASYPPRPLFLLGAEAAGLPKELMLAAELLVEIPMLGSIDSLNVAVAGSVVLFDWLRRKGFPGAW